MMSDLHLLYWRCCPQGQQTGVCKCSSRCPCKIQPFVLSCCGSWFWRPFSGLTNGCSPVSVPFTSASCRGCNVLNCYSCLLLNARVCPRSFAHSLQKIHATWRVMGLSFNARLNLSCIKYHGSCLIFSEFWIIKQKSAHVLPTLLMQTAEGA